MYTTYYDLIAHPERISPPYVWYGFWLVLMLTLIGVGVHLARQPGVRGKVFCGATVVMALMAGVGSYRDYVGHGTLRHMIAKGDYRTAEGCLERFHAGKLVGGRDPKTHESWRVGGEDFEYWSGPGEPGYHQTASGAPDATSRVRVAFADTETWGRIIIRLETIRGACPAAPDVIP